MKRNAESRLLQDGMATRYEREQDREPEDVSARNLGFDIRSCPAKPTPTPPSTSSGQASQEGNIRYIEVKARAGIGAVSLTKNEWFIAERFQDDYYLYVVLNAARKPELTIVQNPAKHLQPEQKIDVRYIVSVDEIRNVGVLV